MKFIKPFLSLLTLQINPFKLIKFLKPSFHTKILLYKTFNALDFNFYNSHFIVWYARICLHIMLCISMEFYHTIIKVWKYIWNARIITGKMNLFPKLALPTWFWNCVQSSYSNFINLNTFFLTQYLYPSHFKESDEKNIYNFKCKKTLW